MKPNIEYFFTINASYQDCLRLYSGNKRQVILLDEAGVKVSLPVDKIKPFITRLGLRGRFYLLITPQNKIKEFTQLD